MPREAARLGAHCRSGCPKICVEVFENSTHHDPESSTPSRNLYHFLKLKDGAKEVKEDRRQHQLAPGACDEVRQGYASLSNSSFRQILICRLQSLSDTSLPSSRSVLERPSSSSFPATLLLFASLSWSTTACWPRPQSTTSPETT